MDASQRSWIDSANDPSSDFPLDNLPYGAFKRGGASHLGVAIGDRVLDLHACAVSGLLHELPDNIQSACKKDLLNELMSLGSSAWGLLRNCLTSMLGDRIDESQRSRIAPHLLQQHELEMVLPAAIGSYTDFYTSIHHATRIGNIFRPGSPLLPNYKYIPIGYHGRASSILVSGSPVRRPRGQVKHAGNEPEVAPTNSLDYELEIGAFIGPGNILGQPVPIAESAQHIFGLCLVNDWSARDIQAWECQPLGPFLAKSFSTSISPWIVPMEALAPYRVPLAERAPEDPAPLPYLRSPSSSLDAFDVRLEVFLQSERMRLNDSPPLLLSASNLQELYWSINQMVAHHTSNGCNLQPGDLLATGTISGPANGSEGCLLEKTAFSLPISLPGGEERRFLEDGDTVIFRACANKEGCPRIGFGECRGTIEPSWAP